MWRFLLILALVGCTERWNRPGATQADLDRDWYVCSTQAAQTVGTGPVAQTSNAGVDLGNTLMRNGQGDEMRQACLRAHGWTQH
jgi:hypothetical protein